MSEQVSPNTVLDEKYRIIRSLGGGGFGEVYLAEDMLLHNRHVAIKSLIIDDPDQEHYLIREMQFLASLEDTNIVRFHHHFRHQDTLFLVMELCGRGSLRQYLETEGRFSIDQVLQWAKLLCRTLHLVHEKNIVHCDIKPDNILLTEEGVLKIGDFGVANTRGGTVPYLAPELFLPGERVPDRDCRIDIYALGITILELLTGDNPFFVLSGEDALHAKVRLDFVSESLPLWLKEIILKALQPKPELRFQTMREFQEALQSRHVPYIISRKRILADRISSKAEWHLKRKKWLTARNLAEQALLQDADCISALLLAGRCELLMRKIEKASRYFERAVKINPRVDIQKELGWIYLEKGRYPEAISLFNDHLQRNAADYEGYNLLLKTFYLTGRYEVGSNIASTILNDYKENKCFENNYFLCQSLRGRSDKDFFLGLNKKNPFIRHNLAVFLDESPSWSADGDIPLKSKLLFQEFHFGNLHKLKPNSMLIENDKGKQEIFNQPIITVGRLEQNDVVINHPDVSRRHCVIVNYADDVWLYDMNSTYGTFCDGRSIDTCVFLEGVHRIKIADLEFKISAREGILI